MNCNTKMLLSQFLSKCNITRKGRYVIKKKKTACIRVTTWYNGCVLDGHEVQSFKVRIDKKYHLSRKSSSWLAYAECTGLSGSTITHMHLLPGIPDVFLTAVRCRVLGFTVTTLDPRGAVMIFPPWVWMFNNFVPVTVPDKKWRCTICLDVKNNHNCWSTIYMTFFSILITHQAG